MKIRYVHDWHVYEDAHDALGHPRTPVLLLADAQAEITALRQQVAELEAAEKRYFDVFRRISEAHGISSPLVLIGKAINDDENYAEILARIVEEKKSKVLAGDAKKDASA
jgi:hypothetical protein